ncbi:hypothetical protein AAJ76_2270002392 [Vairimorpha ceranae]|uniref:Uncharacterized protein n=1 Tax=Vairimorpha ceranae TaxID=40302 RepID=A0A0F9Z7A2_9MICR|nr:hypothetical protein AAJ76_2270002392 [Vairimorpha ceranae]KKO73799.1 hypothetical protein AAJ76_2270002392 [Vairimorpha ceranae]
MLKEYIRTKLKTRGLILSMLTENVAVLIKGELVFLNEWKWRKKNI